MIPKLSVFERFVGWLVFAIERKSGFCGGFDEDDEDGILFSVEHPEMMRVVGIYRDYVTVRMVSRKVGK